MEMVLDTSGAHLFISLLKEGEIQYLSKLEDCVKHSTKVLEMIDTSLHTCNASLSDVETLYIVNGPGSFTGLRVGVTIAKMIGYTKKIKVVPISSLELMATTPFEGDYVVPYIDARRGYVFGAVYDKNLNPVIPDGYIKIEDLVQSFPQGKCVGISYTPVEGLPVEIDPKEDPRKIVQKHRADVHVDPHQICPNYLKKTEAEEKRND